MDARDVSKGNSSLAIDGADPVLRMVPSRPRLVIAVAVLAALGLLLIEIAVTGSFGGISARLGLLAVASGAFLLAYTVWRTGRVSLELAAGTLRETGPEGRILARLEDIRGVDRGAFAFKPSNGFLLRLTTRGPAAWVPGLWWRRGRIVGVGGLVPAHQAKLVAEAISLELAKKRSSEGG